eukprot:CAMPEP_0185825988 /NCGR_PEP_ID=MMETSP1322-20130828/31319_1 /TAXON_ID=265543 /ORGANISM="Minutocellus polymorphus, Strain RCC2270" /LENGTH=418 /DNA_ID=CAMNT_0028523713 /DNA_START=301 /DNA_END=1554 /DNA_ORIENTATION=+
MTGPAALSMTTTVALAVLALVALLWAAPVSAAAGAPALIPHSAPGGGRPARTRQLQTQEEGDETAGAGTTIATSGIFSAAGLTAPSLLEIDAQCRSPLFQSDGNNDGRIDRDEYAFFANALSGGYFTASACTTNNSGSKIKRCDFDGLPLALQSNFINLACLCERFQFGADGEETDGCCVGDNAHISAAGAGPDEEPTEREALYLLTVCRETYTAVEEVRTAPPTEKPTKAPTESPTERDVYGRGGGPDRASDGEADQGSDGEPHGESDQGSDGESDQGTYEQADGEPYRPAHSESDGESNEEANEEAHRQDPDDPTAGPTEAAEAPTPVAAPTTTTTPTAAPTVPTVPSAPSAPTSPGGVTGPLPVSFGYAISNLGGYDAAAIVADPPAGGNTIAADLRGALWTFLVPEVVAETFGG